MKVDFGVPRAYIMTPQRLPPSKGYNFSLHDSSFPASPVMPSGVMPSDDGEEPAETVEDENIPFTMEVWMSSLGADISTSKTQAMLALCSRIGICSLDDLEMVASAFTSSLPRGVSPVTAFRVHQLMQKEGLFGATAANIRTYADFLEKIFGQAARPFFRRCLHTSQASCSAQARS